MIHSDTDYVSRTLYNPRTMTCSPYESPEYLLRPHPKPSRYTKDLDVRLGCCEGQTRPTVPAYCAIHLGTGMRFVEVAVHYSSGIYISYQVTCRREGL